MSGVPVLFNGPTALPVTVDRVKAARRISSRSEDVLLETYLDVAVQSVQEYTRRQLVTARYRLTLPGFPSGSYGGAESRFGRYDNAIELRRCPVIGVNSIKYYDSDGTQQTLAASEYDVFNTYEPCLIKPSFGNSWPTTRAQENAVLIEFTAGYIAPFTINDTTDTLTGDGIWDLSDDDEITVWSMERLYESTGISESKVYYVVGAAAPAFQISETSGGAAFDITGDSAYQAFAAVHPFPSLALQLVTMLAGHWYSNRCPPAACGCTAQGHAGISEFEGLMNMLAWESPLLNR